MIFDVEHKDDKTYLIPTSFVNDAWQLYEMLDNAFPYNHKTYQGNSWEFFIASYGAFENAVMFNK